MAMVVVDDSCLQANSQPKQVTWLGLRVGGSLFGFLRVFSYFIWFSSQYLTRDWLERPSDETSSDFKRSSLQRPLQAEECVCICMRLCCLSVP